MEDVTPNASETLTSSVTVRTTLPTLDEEVIWTSDVVQRVATLAVVMVATFFGNTAIILLLTCSKHMRSRHRRVNIFIINLAVGDLAVCLFTMSSELLFVVFGHWVLGEAACKIFVYTQIVTLASTTFILAAMSYDRYQAICHPLNFCISDKKAVKSIVGSWILAFLLAIPQLAIFVQRAEGILPDGTIKYLCVSRGYTAEWQRKVYFSWLTIYILIVPGIFITFCYVNVARAVVRNACDTKKGDYGVSLRKTVNKEAVSKTKMKTIYMTLCIVATFLLCWSPYFVTTLISIYSDRQVAIPKGINVMAETMALANSAMNPLLYVVFNWRLVKMGVTGCLGGQSRWGNIGMATTSAAKSSEVVALNYSEEENRKLLKKAVSQTSSGRQKNSVTNVDSSCCGQSQSCTDLTDHRVNLS